MEFKLEITDFNDLSKDQFEISRKKLVDLDARDEAKAAQERAMNNLETQVIDTKDKMYQEIYEKSTTDEEREKIMAKCNELSDWIDEEATFETPVETLESKLKEITDLTTSMHARVKQHNERPEALEAMTKMINSSEYFLDKAKNSTGIVDGYFTQVSGYLLINSFYDFQRVLEKSVKYVQIIIWEQFPVKNCSTFFATNSTN